MSWHLFGLVVTPHGTAANNRGDTEGNITTLQKILWRDEVHTTVSAEAIRWAIRWFWQQQGRKTNRRWSEEGVKGGNVWEDHSFEQWQRFLDDDVLGFMAAEGAKEEGKDGVRTRRARLEVTRAISLSPFAGDLTFNAASIGATPSASRTGKAPVPYGTELHATRYQYGFALTPEALHDPAAVKDVVEAVVSLGNVAGNHARFLYDFSPESLVLRWTQDMAPRILYGFSEDTTGSMGLDRIVRCVEAGDIDAAELFVGGAVSGSPTGRKLAEEGATVTPGVKAAADALLQRAGADLGLG